MAGKLYEKIGDSIAKADPNDDGLDADMGDDENDESPGAKLAEALGLTDGVDVAKVDEALAAAIRKLR